MGEAASGSNRLANETSPYLLQHAGNPVDWYPWGAEALDRARREDKPIFLSIGYAACHWCHVMERESFEDEVAAADLNRDFVAIKVDREERPDLDSVYMDALQQMTGQGGWPMSLFLTPDGKPFYGGTYFPDTPRHGLPSFRQLLANVAAAWRDRRAEVEESGSRLVTAISAPARGSGVSGLSLAQVDAAVQTLEGAFDRRHGGWGSAPKFPQPMALEFLFRAYTRSGDTRALTMARSTLDAMAGGGIRDHLGGGFARYATDAHWLVPHFEKMLYDNAQLARVYLHAWQVTADTGYRDVVVSTLDFVARELRVPPGGAFASSLDADTDGEEGATYVWTLDAVREALGEDAALFAAAYDVRANGNWEGSTILQRVAADALLATTFSMTPEAVAASLGRSRVTLLEGRQIRPQPGRDGKVLAAWNGLMVGAFAEAGRVLAEPRFTAIATEVADFLLARLRGPDGRLGRSWKDDRVTGTAILEDYADLADGLLTLYEATFDERWFTAARALMDVILERFTDPVGGFFDTADDAEVLISRPKDLQDNALPSGNAMAACVLLRLAALTGEGRYRTAAEGALGLVSAAAPRYPTAFAQWLVAMDLAIGPIDEVAIIGDPGDPATQALIAEARRGYRPRQVVAVGAQSASTVIPLLADRPLRDGVPTAYVCQGFACRQPVTSPSALAEQLGAGATR
ncbi:MAG: thioredoxin domain-containing protein, partial [Candidatus Limnocylindrales bacterium]